MKKIPRYIDADVMREEWLQSGENEHVYDTNAILESIDSQPTVDAVEVVRCKDCKHRGTEGDCPMCHDDDWYMIDNTTDEGFCDRGERREENAAD
ncbi:MAG: hypothetical protein IIX10_03080 [Clostridia bacterium]|nr:hypothetical protein [Clostridia bacterium]